MSGKQGLNKGDSLPSGNTLVEAYVAREDWQLWKTQVGSALCVSSAMHQAWMEAGLIEPGVFLPLAGDLFAALYVLSGGPPGAPEEAMAAFGQAGLVPEGTETICLHIASIVSMDPGYNQKVMDVNVGGAKNIIEMCLGQSISKQTFICIVQILFMIATEI